MSKRSFNLDGQFNFGDFKKWMNHNQDHKNKYVGMHIESKISYGKLLSTIESQVGETEDVAKEFKKNGGVISEVDGNYFTVAVDNGSFIIHRMYTRKD